MGLVGLVVFGIVNLIYSNHHTLSTLALTIVNLNNIQLTNQHYSFIDRTNCTSAILIAPLNNPYHLSFQFRKHAFKYMILKGYTQKHRVWGCVYLVGTPSLSRPEKPGEIPGTKWEKMI
jgi:hypothetical protein